jgi:hypothetical protein
VTTRYDTRAQARPCHDATPRSGRGANTRGRRLPFALTSLILLGACTHGGYVGGTVSPYIGGTTNEESSGWGDAPPQPIVDGQFGTQDMSASTTRYDTASFDTLPAGGAPTAEAFADTGYTPDFAPGTHYPAQSLAQTAPEPVTSSNLDHATKEDLYALQEVAFASLEEHSTEQPVALSPVALSAPVVALSDGRCQARENVPAIFEHVMGEVRVTQAEIAPDGTVVRRAAYRKAPVTTMVRPRSEMIFDAVCGHQMTPEFIASLQRALAARGYFAGNVSSTMDPPTNAAVHLYQKERGLDSAQLSLETARALGLITVDTQGG